MSTQTNELARLAPDYPISGTVTIPADPLRPRGKDGRAISLVLKYHAEHKARLARMGGAPLPRVAVPEITPEQPKAVFWRGINEARYWRNMWCWDLVAMSSKPNFGRPNLKRILHVVAAHYGVTPDEIISHRRLLVVSRPRQIVMYLARQLTLRSFPEIGRALGGRDHTTVLYGVSRIEKLIAQSPEMKRTIDELTQEITAR